MASMYKLFLFVYNWFSKFLVFVILFLLSSFIALKKLGSFPLIYLFIPVIRANYPLTHNFITM